MKHKSRKLTGLLAAMALLSVTGCVDFPLFVGESSPYYDACSAPVDRDYCVRPVYLTRDKLDEPAQVLTDIMAPEISGGRLYLYEDRLFVSHPDHALTVWDVSVPEDVQFVAAVDIPLNTDLAIRDGRIYASSYRDLVIIDMTDLTEPGQTRIEDIFPDPVANSWLPWEYELLEEPDPEMGIHVGYETLNGDPVRLESDSGWRSLPAGDFSDGLLPENQPQTDS